MFTRIKKISAAAFTFVSSALMSPTVLAQAGLSKLEDVAGAAGVPGVGSEATLGSIVGSLLKQILGMVGVVLVVLIIYGGLMWMTAGGNDEKVAKGKKVLTNAVIGIVIIFGAYAITEFVLTSVLTATGG